MFRKWFPLIIGLGLVVLALLSLAGPAPTGAQDPGVTATQSTVAPNPTSSAVATGHPGQTPNPTGGWASPVATTAVTTTVNTTTVTVEESADPAACKHEGEIRIPFIQLVVANWWKVCPTATPTPTPTPTVRPVVNGDVVVPMVGKPEILLGVRNADYDFLVYIHDEISGLVQADVHSYDLRGNRADWAGSTLELPTTVITPTHRFVRIAVLSSVPGGVLDVSCDMTDPSDICEVRFAFFLGQNTIEGNARPTTEGEKHRYPLPERRENWRFLWWSLGPGLGSTPLLGFWGRVNFRADFAS